MSSHPVGSSAGTSPSLVVAVHAGESSAWQKLVALYTPRLHRWCRSRGLDESNTADVMQEVWISVSRSIHRFNSTPGAGAFRAWLWRVTERRIIDCHRRLARQAHAVGGSSMQMHLQAIASDESSPSREMISQPVLLAMERVSSHYEPRTWRAFLRSVADGCPTDQVASEFGLTAVAVRQIRSRVLRHLRRELAGIGNKDDGSHSSNL